MLKKQLSRVILLSGTPGVGKTTISKLLKSEGYSVLNFNDFIIQHGLYYCYDHSRESVIIDDEILIAKFTDEIVKFSELLIIEGHTAELVHEQYPLLFSWYCSLVSAMHRFPAYIPSAAGYLFPCILIFYAGNGCLQKECPDP